MPIITPKSPEILQAQAAAFAAEYCGYGDDQDLVREIGNTTVGMEVSFDTPPSQRTNVVSSREKEYVDFLRRNGGQANPLIQDRAQMLEKYKDFSPEAETILADLEGVKSKEWPEHPQYIGKGGTSSVFKIGHEGQEYALRVPRDRNFGIDREYVKPALRTLDQSNMEQMVAISYGAGVTITEIIPGETMREITSKQVEKISDEHLVGLVDSLKKIQDADLMLDPNAGNIFYDPEEGFGIIDLVDGKYRLPLESHNIVSILAKCSDVLVFPLHMEEKKIQMTSEGPRADRQIAELYDVFISLISRYRRICSKKFLNHKSLAMIEYELETRLTRLIEERKLIISRSGDDLTQPKNAAVV